MDEQRTELVNALNAAIVEAQRGERPAAAQLYTVVRDQTTSSPLTARDLVELKRIAAQANDRALSIMNWKRRVTLFGAIGGLVIGLAAVWGAIAPYLGLKP